MAKSFRSVYVSRVTNSGVLIPKYDFDVDIVIEYDPQGLSVKLKKDDNKSEDLSEFPVHRFTECSRLGALSYIFTFDSDSLCLKFPTEADLKRFHSYVKEVKVGKSQSVFSERTDDSSAVQYFKFYGYLSQQQNMLQDFVRTSTYQKAVLLNSEDFKDKVVLDVGAGSGILSFFAVQAGAKRVYAVEASSMALHAETLVNANNLRDKINVIAGKIEEIELPEMVDIIISEPMGYMLFNERMLESYLHAKKWLKENGIMFPNKGDLHIAPFTDESLFMEQTNKANFWVQTCFHGVDLSSMRGAAMKEYFSHPIVDTFDVRICMAKSVKHSVDFSEAKEEDLRKINIPLEFYVLESGMVHGLALWFDVAFTGSNQTVWLSTSPTEPLTHWYQVRCLLEKPIFAKNGQRLTGKILLQANQRQSYDVTMELCIEGAENTRATNTLDLQNPYFRYTGQPVAPPPGVNTTSPSESYWGQLDAQGARQAVNMVNGISVNGLGEVSMDTLQNNAGIIANIVSQPNIHPGSISSTGRQRGAIQGAGSLMPGAGAATSSAGGISPTLFTSPQAAHQLVVGNTAHFPVNNSLMIGDYVTPNSGMMSVQAYRQ